MARQRKRRGRPKKMYKEFAGSVKVFDHDLAALLRVGEVCLKICESGSSALLLLLDWLGTIRQMSVEDVAKLVQSTCNESLVKEIVETLSDPVYNWYLKYQEVTEKLWSPERMAGRVVAIYEIMNSDEPGNHISCSITGNGGEQCQDEPVNDAETTPTQATPLSGQPHLSSPRTSPSLSTPGHHDIGGQHGCQNDVLGSDTRRGMDMLVEAALHSHASPEPRMEHQSAGTESETSGDSAERSSKRRRLNDGASVEAPQSVEASETLGALGTNPFSGREGCHSGNHVADQYDQWLIDHTVDEPRPSFEPATTDTNLTVPKTAADGHAGTIDHRPLDIFDVSAAQHNGNPTFSSIIAPDDAVQNHASFFHHHGTEPDLLWNNTGVVTDVNVARTDMNRQWSTLEDMEMVQQLACSNDSNWEMFQYSAWSSLGDMEMIDSLGFFDKDVM